MGGGDIRGGEMDLGDRRVEEEKEGREGEYVRFLIYTLGWIHTFFFERGDIGIMVF